jgi:uncharacterized metal-binding protein
MSAVAALAIAFVTAGLVLGPSLVVRQLRRFELLRFARIQNDDG